MNRAIYHLRIGIALALLAVMLASVYWGVIQRFPISQREDNPRFVRQEQILARGTIYDRNGTIIAYSQPDPSTDIMQRVYPYPEVVSAVGYYSFRYGSEGIEAAYNPILRGDDPVLSWWEQWRDDWLNRPQHGHDVRSTLDLALQQELMAAFHGQRGAAVIVHIPSGEVWAMASLPSFDPNNIDQQLIQLKKSAKKGDTRLFNRVQDGLYQPGDVMQLVWLPYFFAERYELDDTINGVAPIGDGRECSFNGAPTLQTAFLARCLQPFGDDWQSITEMSFGPLVAAGQFLEAPYFMGGTSTFEDRFIPTSLYPIPMQVNHNEAAGQGQILISPLHLAQWIAAIANDGDTPTLQLATAYRVENDDWQALPNQPSHELLAPTIAEQMRNVMQLEANLYGYSGEAWHGADQSHLSWFGGFADLPNGGGSVVIVVVVENTPTTDSAAQIALPILQAQAMTRDQ